MNNMSRYKMLKSMDTTISGKLLYLILSEITDLDDSVVISQHRISDATGLARTTISKNLHRLCNSGYIGITPRYNEDGGRAANKYVIN